MVVVVLLVELVVVVDVAVDDVVVAEVEAAPVAAAPLVPWPTFTAKLSAVVAAASAEARFCWNTAALAASRAQIAAVSSPPSPVETVTPEVFAVAVVDDSVVTDEAKLVVLALLLMIVASCSCVTTVMTAPPSLTFDAFHAVAVVVVL